MLTKFQAIQSILEVSYILQFKYTFVSLCLSLQRLSLASCLGKRSSLSQTACISFLQSMLTKTLMSTAHNKHILLCKDALLRAVTGKEQQLFLDNYSMAFVV